MTITLDLVANFCLTIIGASLLLTLFRILKGPTVPDKIAALDLTAALSIAAIGIVCIKTDDHSYLDIAVVLALVAFLGTISFARYLELRRQRPK